MKLLLWNCLCPMAYHDDTVFTDLSLMSLTPMKRESLFAIFLFIPVGSKADLKNSGADDGVLRRRPGLGPPQLGL